ncbi:hypothetical protein Pyn_08649 [Prunus yedoensis var. nudiflora]|uniref:Uncharacterized protein n=1 Tax=Prunus yedoensis var. nudiflora TaxID=2094558 RepID=A0A314U9C7_PRUYE|nr:hypothetical protein Pyn_08649 [Prunus yedoensis var. nudiflora]
MDKNKDKITVREGQDSQAKPVKAIPVLHAKQFLKTAFGATCLVFIHTQSKWSIVAVASSYGKVGPVHRRSCACCFEVTGGTVCLVPVKSDQSLRNPLKLKQNPVH